MATTAIDQSRLEAFMGQAVVDLAAAFSAPLVRLGARLGLYRALAEGGPATPDGAGGADRDGAPDGAGVARQPGRRRLRDLRRGERDVHAPAGAGGCARRRSERVLPARCVRHPGVVLRRRGPPGRGVPQRRGLALERARPPSLHRDGGLLPRRLPPAPGGRAGCPRSTASSRSWRRGRAWRTSAAVTAPRRSSWPRPSRPRLRGLRLACGRDRARPRSGRRGRRRGPGAVRGGGRRRVPRRAATTSSASSTRSTTSAIRPQRRATSARRWRPTGR